MCTATSRGHYCYVKVEGLPRGVSMAAIARGAAEAGATFFEPNLHGGTGINAWFQLLVHGPVPLRRTDPPVLCLIAELRKSCGTVSHLNWKVVATFARREERKPQPVVNVDILAEDGQPVSFDFKAQMEYEVSKLTRGWGCTRVRGAGRRGQLSMLMLQFSSVEQAKAAVDLHAPFLDGVQVSVGGRVCYLYTVQLNKKPAAFSCGQAVQKPQRSRARAPAAKGSPCGSAAEPPQATAESPGVMLASPCVSPPPSPAELTPRSGGWQPAASVGVSTVACSRSGSGLSRSDDESCEPISELPSLHYRFEPYNEVSKKYLEATSSSFP